ncbi:uncharacterized protein LOC122499179 [Leptopilina heterotoma]|uniref:uncharacterized protein LOC122499179 n=1 Tax=Leptopilina heterotoma TaxID=63436 RepID=UPI001CA8D911|nr:uncharacterized protein LOC122499179 [Leptopilina heterotoma]
MLSFSGDFYMDENQSLDYVNGLNSENKKHILIRRIRMANFGTYNHWFRKNSEKYGAATYLLPVGSVFVLTIIILLMVMFKRCPQLVAAIVTGILGTIAIFTVLVTINHPDVYE